MTPSDAKFLVRVGRKVIDESKPQDCLLLWRERAWLPWLITIPPQEHAQKSQGYRHDSDGLPNHEDSQ